MKCHPCTTVMSKDVHFARHFLQSHLDMNLESLVELLVAESNETFSIGFYGTLSKVVCISVTPVCINVPVRCFHLTVCLTCHAVSSMLFHFSPEFISHL